MVDYLIRNVPPELLEKLKTRAASQKRSLQQEMLVILNEAVSYNIDEAITLADRIRESLSDGNYSDSTKLIREDRER